MMYVALTILTDAAVLLINAFMGGMIIALIVRVLK